MISKEEFEKYFKSENKMLSRNNLYVVYQFLLTLNSRIEDDYKFSKEKIESYYFLLNDNLQRQIKQINDIFIHVDFWDLMINNSHEVEKDRDRRMSSFFKDKTGMQKDYCSLHHYQSIILRHLIPINQQVIQSYNKKVESYLKEREKRQNKNKSKNSSCDNGGIYGIYENDILVYIGMTTRPFEARWKEHQERIEKGSTELALYGLIDANAKIEFKKLLEVDKMECNDKITKRDLQAMEFALIQEHRPKYNFAGRTQPYQF